MHCAASFWPKYRVVGCTIFNNLITTVATPRKCPGRDSPSDVSSKPYHKIMKKVYHVNEGGDARNKYDHSFLCAYRRINICTMIWAIHRMGIGCKDMILSNHDNKQQKRLTLWEKSNVDRKWWIIVQVNVRLQAMITVIDPSQMIEGNVLNLHSAQIALD